MADAIKLGEWLYNHRRLIHRPFIPTMIVTLATGLVLIRFSIGPVWLQAATFATATLFILKAFWIFPHERRWLENCRDLTRNCDYDAAERCLSDRPIWLSARARIQADLTRLALMAEKGDSLPDEHRLVVRLQAGPLMSDEADKVMITHAFIHYRGGHYRLFREQLVRIARQRPQLTADVQYQLLLAFQRELDGDYDGAKTVLESLLDRPLGEKDAIMIYNNLGRLEAIGHNHIQALHFYNKALDVGRQHPEASPKLVGIVYQNLIHLYARTQKPHEALKMLREYRTAIDTDVIHQFQEFLNTQIALARHLRLLALALEGYAVMDVKFRPKLDAKQQLALLISEFHMRANDGIGFHEHLLKVNLSFDNIVHQPFPARYDQLRHIYRALRSVEAAGPLDPNSLDLMKRTIAAMRNSSPDIHLYRKSMPDVLADLHFYWVGELIELHKLAPSKDEDYDETFYKTLFDLLQELIRITEGKENPLLTLEALMRLCDDYIGFAPHLTPSLDALYKPLAVDSLKQANKILNDHGANPELWDYMVGVAWGEWKINNNKQRAKRWIELFDSKNISPLQFAVWMRRYYGEVKAYLKLGR